MAEFEKKMAFESKAILVEIDVLEEDLKKINETLDELLDLIEE